MKSNIYLYIIIILFVVSEIWVILSNRQLKNEIKIKDNYIESISGRYVAIETQFYANIVNTGKTIEDNIKVKDTSNNEMKISDIAKNKLICRYSEKHCFQCVEHAISIITDNSDSLDHTRILFIGNGGKRNLIVNAKEFGIIDFEMVDCPNLGIPAEEAMFPYIMAVDSSLRVLSVYFPTKSTHGTDYDYRHVKYMYDNLIR